MKTYLYSICAFTLATALPLWGEELEAPAETCPSYSRSQAVYLKHIEGKGVGYKQGYSTLGLFFSPNGSAESFFPFVDLRGHVFNDGKYAAYAGLGFRYLFESPWIFGFNISYGS